MYKDGATADDVMQGTVGDCYLMSALCALTKHPELISKLLPWQSGVDPDGRYKVRLCKNGSWQEVTLDDHIPCYSTEKIEDLLDEATKKKLHDMDDEKREATMKKLHEMFLPAFTRSPEHEMWVLLIEKAWAKLHGSYQRIEGGKAGHVMRDLTGAPSERLLTTNQEGAESPKIWAKLREAHEEGWLLATGSRYKDSKAGKIFRKKTGLIPSHAYSILAVVEVDGHRLIKLRNPHGRNEWKGDWSDGSKKWTPKLKEQLGVEEKK
jgi:calpain-15